MASLLARKSGAQSLQGHGRLLTATASRHASSLASLVHAHAKAAPSSLALAAPQQDVNWSYAELSKRATGVAFSLARMGYTRGDIVVTDLPNSCENLLLQVACSHLGVAVATAKDAKALDALRAVGNVKGSVTHTSEGATEILKTAEFEAGRVVIESLDGTLAQLSSDAIVGAVTADDSAALAYWGNTTPLTNGEAFDVQGAHALEALQITAADRVLVSITLCHAFGIASAVGSALTAGAAVVLPGSSGIRGCGSPTQRAQVTLSVLESQKCSVLFADVHTLKALPPPGTADLSALRCGACKVGSGADFLTEVREAKLGPDGEMRPLEYAGVTITAVGKK